jgi:4a-hydroxytetrahydrobiopterin dehydratase
VVGVPWGMARYTALADADLHAALAALPGWVIQDGKLHRRFVFTDFAAAIAFMVRSSFDAERLDHHPNWSNVYDRVEVTLWTHDVGGLTDRDVALATAMQGHAAALAPRGQ